MFISRKKLKKTIENQQKTIKQQQNVIENLNTYAPVLQNLKIASEEYITTLQKVTDNELKYLHVIFDNIISMVNLKKLEIIKNINGEVQKISDFYIEKILNREDKNADK